MDGSQSPGLLPNASFVKEAQRAQSDSNSLYDNASQPLPNRVFPESSGLATDSGGPREAEEEAGVKRELEASEAPPEDAPAADARVRRRSIPEGGGLAKLAVKYILPPASPRNIPLKESN